MGTLPAGEESGAGGSGYGDDRVRLRGRRDQGDLGAPNHSLQREDCSSPALPLLRPVRAHCSVALQWHAATGVARARFKSADWRPEGPATAAAEAASVNPFSACLPHQPLLSAAGGKGPGLIRKYFGDIMETPGAASASPRSAAYGAGPPRPGSSSSSGPPSGANSPLGRGGGGGVSSLLSRLSAAAGKPAFASGGPSLSAIGDSLLSRGVSVQQGPSAARMRRHGSAASVGAAAKGGKGE